MAGPVRWCGGRSTPGTRHPDGQPESASIRSHGGECQNRRRAWDIPLRPIEFHAPPVHRSLVSSSNIALIGRTTGRKSNDGHRERIARCRPTPCRLPLEPQRTAEGLESAAGNSVLDPGRSLWPSRPWQPTVLHRTCVPGNRCPILRLAAGSMSGLARQDILNDGDDPAGHGQRRKRDHAPRQGSLRLLRDRPIRSGSRGPSADAHLCIRHAGLLDESEGLPSDESSRCSTVQPSSTPIPSTAAQLCSACGCPALRGRFIRAISDVPGRMPGHGGDGIRTISSTTLRSLFFARRWPGPPPGPPLLLPGRDSNARTSSS